MSGERVEPDYGRNRHIRSDTDDGFSRSTVLAAIDEEIKGFNVHAGFKALEVGGAATFYRRIRARFEEPTP